MQRRMPTFAVVVDYLSTHDLDHFFECLCFPQQGSILRLEATSERFDLGIVPGSTLRVGKPTAVFE